MELEKRAQLTAELQKLVAEIASDLKRQLDVAGPARTRAEVVYRDERVGYDFDVWLDLLARRAAVLWVLKTVYVRVLEDRGFLTPVRIRDRESQELFEHLTPGLGDTAYLRWVFKDLASDGGLPELFAPQPAEVAFPSNDLSKKLLAFWRSQDEATHALRFRFDDEHFDGRLMGDLYQDLDPIVKERYALLQTPENVVEFVLDETLTPAIAEFGIDVVRIIDPACGSGHFLLAAFKRLVKGMREKFPERPVIDIVQGVLARVVGIDLNDYACGLARARLVMTALETVGETTLSSGAAFHPQVLWADGLEQVERDEQVEIAAVTGDAVRATLTRPEIRKALRPLLKEGFHVIVANPPYITEKDPKQREYHREKVGRTRRYISASGKYSLGNPFTERMFQLAVPGGFIGDFNANSFMKREFGKALIEQVLAKQDLFEVIDLGGARFADYGTPTVLLFARRRAPKEPDVLVVMGKKGDPAGRPGLVWASAMAGHGAPGFEDEYVSVARVARDAINVHPWSIGGGGAADLKLRMDEVSATRFRQVALSGVMTVTGADEVYAAASPIQFERRLPRAREAISRFCFGDGIRDWSITAAAALYPYSETGRFSETLCEHSWFWPFRPTLSQSLYFGQTKSQRGLDWRAYAILVRGGRSPSLKIAWGEVATHNHFALDLGSTVFSHTAPVAHLLSGSRQDANAALGVLNASTTCFWMKQVCQNKGSRGEGGGVCAEEWEQFFQFSATKLENLPLPDEQGRVAEHAERLDALARERAADCLATAVAGAGKSGAGGLRSALAARRSRDTDRLLCMVALQEELDWLCYQLYGVDRVAPANELRSPDQLTPYRPGLRPFEITLAREDQERRGAISRGEDPDEAPTAWFERHGWEPATTFDELPESEREIVEARLARTAASRELSLLEQPTYKRRWYKPDYEAEEHEALELWLSDRIEGWAKERREPFTVEEAASALQADTAVLAVAAVLTGRPDFNLVELVAERVHEDAVPNNKHHVFKPSGLTKRAAWERTWEMQRAEDEATKRGGTAPAPPVPPKYAKGDFLRDGYWSLRGPLDVPKERFIALTEVPGREGKDLLFAWAGLSHRERAKMLVELDEQAERAGMARSDRIGILHGVWFLADYVAWESEQAARQYRAAVTTVVGQAGITEELLSEWATNHPAPRLRRQRPPRRRNDVEETDDT
jgi:methylase of polypeptide subunit release factors